MLIAITKRSLPYLQRTTINELNDLFLQMAEIVQDGTLASPLVNIVPYNLQQTTECEDMAIHGAATWVMAQIDSGNTTKQFER